MPDFKKFNCDILIEDGDCFTFGNTTVRCLLTPGHADGVLSFFINIEDGDDSITAAMHGVIGTNSLTFEFLNSYGLSFSCRDKFIASIKRLRAENVDLVMGNHPHQNDTEGKLKKLQLGAKTIVDKDEWQKLLDKAEKNLLGMIESEKES